MIGVASTLTVLLFQTSPSIQVQVQPDTSAKILQIVLSVAVALISISTFALGYRKRIRERRASWYQKIVVDDSLPRLFEFFKSAERDLFAAVSTCENCAAEELSGEVTAAIASFSRDLIAVQDFITDKLLVFDEAMTGKVTARFLKLQDDISECFETHVIKKRGNTEDIRNVLLGSQREIIKLLYECEFQNF